MDRSNIEKIAHTPEDKLLLAKLWDKINAGLRREMLVATGFLSPRELDMTRYLFGELPGLTAFGGYDEAERKMLVYLPEYLDSSYLSDKESPLVCLRASFYESDALCHRDFLGALMGAGISRECVGDIRVGHGCCDFFVTAEIAPYILQNFTCAGRAKISVQAISLRDINFSPPETQEIRDTVASLRLDSVVSSGFRIARSLAAQRILAGYAAIDGLPCEKPDKIVPEGAKISVRGLGKIRLRSVGGQTKKGRIGITIDRYI